MDQELFERKNLVLFAYILFFAVLCIAYHISSLESSFYSGVIGILLILLYPIGAFFYGYKTGDGLRAPLAGAVSYAFLVLFAFYFRDPAGISNILLVTGYHLVLLVCLGLIGYLASGKERLHLVAAGVLSVAWILFLISGIS